MKFTTHIFAIFLLFFAAAACKKDKKKPQASTAHKILLRQELSEEYTATYTYDASDRLVSVVKTGNFMGPSVDHATYTISYGANGKISTMLSEFTGTVDYRWKDEYTYDANKRIQEIKVYWRNDLNAYELWQTDKYVYLPDGIIDVISMTVDDNWTRARYFTSGGNTTEYQAYINVSESNLEGTQIGWIAYSQFDDKKYMYSPLPQEFEPNNRFVNNYRQLSTSGGTVTNYEYDYDDAGYPIRQTSNQTVIFYVYE
jgi:hypothetical protein